MLSTLNTTPNFDHYMHSPGLSVVKDHNSVFQAMSPCWSELLGWKSPQEALGKNDYEIPCSASEHAPQFVNLDMKVLKSGKKMLLLDILPYVNGWRLILLERTAFHGSQFLYGHANDVTNTKLFRAYLFLQQQDAKLTGKTQKPISYILNDYYSPLNLTEKQENCLFLLVRGKTVKEIAKILNISPRTVEGHLEAIKIKMNCKYKSEIIEHAIDCGFLYYIPKDFQEAKYNKIITEL